MKKLMTISAIVLAALLSKNADAQVGIHVNLNIGHPRPVIVAQAPVYDDYYYLPEVEAYYSVPQQVYYYMDGGRWTSARYLPGKYHNYDWRSARRYEVHAQRPYMNHDSYRSQYGGFNNRYNDNDNRYSNNERYSRVIPNRGYDNNRQPERNDNRGWGNDKDRGHGNGNRGRSGRF
jgi:hypothetical protein